MHFLQYLFFRIWVDLLKYIPSIKPILTQIAYFILAVVIKYRSKVIQKNLESAFPYKGKDEIRRITKQYYHHLARLIVQSSASYTLDSKKVLEHISTDGLEYFEQDWCSSNSAIYLGSHSGNWEIAALGVGLMKKQEVLVVYQTISNPRIDRFIRRSRAKFNITLVHLNALPRALASRKDSTYSIILLADQFPGYGAHPEHHDFFGLDTLWYSGLSKLAQRMGLKPYYFYIEEVQKYHFRAFVKPLPPDQQIMEAFVQNLESDIKHQPYNWLWSHKRWKNIDGFYKVNGNRG